MLWMRETEISPLDTPERSAALEARIGEIIGDIGNETVRQYYRQDFEARVRALFAPASATPFSRDKRFDRRNPQGRDFNRGDWKRGGRAQFRSAIRSRRHRRGLARARSSAAHKSAMPSREALILLAVIEHPWLLETHAEEFAELEFVHPDADRLRRAILEAGPDEAGSTQRRCRARSSGAGSRACSTGSRSRSPTPRIGRPGRARRRTMSLNGGRMSLPCIARRAR